MPNGAQATKQDVRAIPIRLETELTAEFAQPEHRLGRPVFHQGKNELSCDQNQSKDAAHALHRMDPEIFDIQSLFLIEAVAMFDATAQAPIGIDLLSGGNGTERNIGQ